MRYTRNEFLKLIGLSGATVLTGAGTFAKSPDAEKATLPLGLASYTFRKFSLDDVIKMTRRLGLGSIALKSMHMPLESSPDDIKAIAGKIRDAGLNLYGAGVIYMKTRQEVETAFGYANHAGLEMIIGVPNHELLPLANEQVKKYNIKLAIHNHGPGDTLYTSPSDVYEKIKSLDKRIGLCMDIGHVVRIGQDPVPMIEQYKDRLYDMHMKDEDKAAPEGKPIEIGRGVIDIPGIVAALKKINYNGQVAFEYEKSEDDPLPGLAESVGYVRGVMRVRG
jgi:sugar phosphate isomerase/epimerase